MNFVSFVGAIVGPRVCWIGVVGADVGPRVGKVGATVGAAGRVGWESFG